MLIERSKNGSNIFDYFLHFLHNIILSNYLFIKNYYYYYYFFFIFFFFVIKTLQINNQLLNGYFNNIIFKLLKYFGAFHRRSISPLQFLFMN